MRIAPRLVALFVALYCLLGSTGCVFIQAFPDYSSLTEVEVQKPDKWYTWQKVLMLDCSGIIAKDTPGLFRDKPSMLVYVTDCLQAAEKDPSIKAVILRINSPGGDATSSDLIYREIEQFKNKMKEKDRDVKVVAALMDLSASGGYYIAMAADEVYALPTSVTGSIGVIALFPDIQKLSGMVGLNMRVFKSGQKKDIGSMFRDMTEEEQKILQGVVDSMYQRFVDVVAENRSELTREEVLELADGRIYTANQALKSGLIDDVKYLDDVIDRAESLAKIKDSKVVMYKYRGTYKTNIYASQDLPAPRLSDAPVNLINIDAGDIGQYAWPRFQYRWLP